MTTATSILNIQNYLTWSCSVAKKYISGKLKRKNEKLHSKLQKFWKEKEEINNKWKCSDLWKEWLIIRALSLQKRNYKDDIKYPLLFKY